MQKGHPRRPSGGCSTGDVPQSGLGAGSAVLHLRRETGKSASEHGRVGDGGRAPRDVVRRICRRVTYGAEELYYIQRGETGKMRLSVIERKPQENPSVAHSKLRGLKRMPLHGKPKAYSKPRARRRAPGSGWAPRKLS